MYSNVTSRSLSNFNTQNLMYFSMAADYAAIIAAKGGTITGPAFEEGRVHHVRVACGNGHEWTPRISNLVHSDSWCPECYGNTLGKIEDLHAWALELGGRCLSEHYFGNKSKYSWECGQCQHVWDATWNNVNSRNSWCPECKTSIREQITRKAFQENFPGSDFAKDRDAVGMELDGYSETHGLAFEHDGLQHRVRVEHFQRNEGDFEAQLERDIAKDDLCNDAGITLIRVPDRGVLAHNKIRAFVRAKIIELGYEVPAELPDEKTFFAGVRAARGESPYLVDATQIVVKRGGVLISESCPTRAWPLFVRCSHGHEFETYFDNLSRGRWCPTCGGTQTKSDQAIAELVTQRDYEFLHTEMRIKGGRSRRYVTVQCPNAEHEPSELLWDNFKKGRGCTPCGRARAGGTKRANPEAIQIRLDAIGFTLETPLSTLAKPGIFVCGQGHRFTSTLKKVEMARPGNRCPSCVIEDMADVRLLGVYGPETDPIRTELRWGCTECGFEFQCTYRGMRIRKQACRKCSGKKV
jgi:predicted nucleic acid-binding Zn ribbon protein